MTMDLNQALEKVKTAYNLSDIAANKADIATLQTQLLLALGAAADLPIFTTADGGLAAISAASALIKLGVVAAVQAALGIKNIEFGTWTHTSTSATSWVEKTYSYANSHAKAPYVFLAQTSLFSIENIAITNRTSTTQFKMKINCDAAFTWSGYWIAIEPI